MILLKFLFENLVKDGSRGLKVFLGILDGMEILCY